MDRILERLSHFEFPIPSSAARFWTQEGMLQVMKILRLATLVAFLHISLGWLAFLAVAIVPNSYGFGLAFPFELLYPVMRILGPSLGLIGIYFFAKSLRGQGPHDLLFTTSSVGVLVGHVALWLRNGLS